MSSKSYQQLQQAILTAQDLVHRLVLVVGPVQAGKTWLLRELAAETDWTVTNVNLELSERLLELTARQRSLRLPEILADIAGTGQSPILLDNLEILFDKSLRQDPLRLLKGLSRDRLVVAAWNGTWADDVLTYAEYGHPEHKHYSEADLVIVSLTDDNNFTTAQST